MKVALGLSLWILLGAGGDSSGSSTLDRLLGRIPVELAPGAFELEVVSGNSRMQAAVEKRKLLVSADLLQSDASVWLHEIGHFAAAGNRPIDPSARRLLVAIEEGVADYYAAALSGSPRIGDPHARIRDLTHPPGLAPETWLALGLPGFDPHPFGWTLAAKLWRAQPNAGSLLVDLLHALRTGAFRDVKTPRTLIAAFLRSCPPRSRHSLDQILSAWLPRELGLEEAP